ncbi:hypothetical protein, partial [Enterobacter hormaechei]|uniref:hypothetical protein n=1 Tax=Enterobacter hormaechei TaxID=158836 RepID=UPI00197A948A
LSRELRPVPAGKEEALRVEELQNAEFDRKLAQELFSFPTTVRLSAIWRRALLISIAASW